MRSHPSMLRDALPRQMSYFGRMGHAFNPSLDYRYKDLARAIYRFLRCTMSSLYVFVFVFVFGLLFFILYYFVPQSA